MIHNFIISIYYHLLTLDVQVRLLISSSCILECKHMPLAMSMLNNIFPLHTKMQNYHLKYPNVLINIIKYIFFHFKSY